MSVPLLFAKQHCNWPTANSYNIENLKNCFRPRKFNALILKISDSQSAPEQALKKISTLKMAC